MAVDSLIEVWMFDMVVGTTVATASAALVVIGFVV